MRSRRCGAPSAMAGESSTAIAATIRRIIGSSVRRWSGAILPCWPGVAEDGPILIAIDNQRDDSSFVRDALAGAGATATTATTGSDRRRTFVMLPRREGPERLPGVPLTLVGGSANTGRFALQDPTDGSPLTHSVSKELQRGGEQVVVQLDGVHRLTGITLSMGRFAESYPRRLRIETSRDGLTWNTATEGSTAGLAFSAMIRSAVRAEFSFRLPDVEGQFVRLSQLDADSNAYWVITDITILGQ